MDFTRPAYQAPAPDQYWPYKPIVLLAGLAPVREALHARLKAAYAALPASVPSAERLARAADLDARQREFELQEESIILESERAGVTIMRRADVSADVVLRAVLAE